MFFSISYFDLCKLLTLRFMVKTRKERRNMWFQFLLVGPYRSLFLLHKDVCYSVQFLYRLYLLIGKMHYLICQSGRAGKFIYRFCLLIWVQHLSIVNVEGLAHFHAVKQLGNFVDICSCAKCLPKDTTSMANERT